MWFIKMAMMATCSLSSNKNPMAMLMMILVSSMGLAASTLTSAMSPWVSIMVVLIFISGIMVLFMYVVSLSTPTSKPISKATKKLGVMMTVIIMLLLPLKTHNTSNQINNMESVFSMNSSLVMVTMLIVVMSGVIFLKMSSMAYKGLKSSN